MNKSTLKFLSNFPKKKTTLKEISETLNVSYQMASKRTSQLVKLKLVDVDLGTINKRTRVLNYKLNDNGKNYQKFLTREIIDLLSL